MSMELRMKFTKKIRGTIIG